MEADSKQANNLDVLPFTPALVNILTFILIIFSEYVTADTMKHNDLAREIKFWLKMFDFSVNKASFAAGQLLGAL